MRYVSSALFILLMLLIQLTGNYCFFNFLGIALSLLLLDDKALLPAFGWLFPGTALPLYLVHPPAALNVAGIAVAVVIIALSLRTVLRLFRLEIDWPRSLEPIVEFFEGFRLVNSYGLFSVMTTERPEIIIEGSNDGIQWHEYQFKWKPGDITRAPRFIAPHQPRLDWQLWFAALGFYQNHPWLRRFLKRLLEGSPEVLSLLRTNPFSGTNPRFVRGVLYDYRFTTQAERRAANERLARISEEEREVKEKIDVYQRLKGLNILGEERRLEWADAITRIRTQRELLDLRYTVERQRSLTSLPGKPGNVDFFASTMKVELALLHEDDLLRFLSDLRQTGNAFYSVKKCALARTGQAITGATMTPRLRADCEVDLITIMDRAAKK